MQDRRQAADAVFGVVAGLAVNVRLAAIVMTGQLLRVVYETRAVEHVGDPRLVPCAEHAAHNEPQAERHRNAARDARGTPT